MFSSLSVRLALCALLVAAIFCSGWTVRGWKNDSEQAAIDRAADAIIKKTTENETGIAQKVEQTLSGLKANQTVIDRGVIRERETQSVVYSAVCFPESGRLLVNRAAKGQLPSQPAEPIGQVSGGSKRTP